MPHLWGPRSGLPRHRIPRRHPHTHALFTPRLSLQIPVRLWDAPRQPRFHNRLCSSPLLARLEIHARPTRSRPNLHGAGAGSAPLTPPTDGPRADAARSLADALSRDGRL